MLLLCVQVNRSLWSHLGKWKLLWHQLACSKSFYSMGMIVPPHQPFRQNFESLLEFPPSLFTKFPLMTRIFLQRRFKRSPLSADIAQFLLSKSIFREMIRWVPASLTATLSLNSYSYKDCLPWLMHFPRIVSSKNWIDWNVLRFPFANLDHTSLHFRIIIINF